MVRSTPTHVAAAAVCSEDGESFFSDTSHTDSELDVFEADDMYLGSGAGTGRDRCGQTASISRMVPCAKDHTFLADTGLDQVPKSNQNTTKK